MPRGGARENGGRKKLPPEQRKKKMSISGSKEELEEIKTKAQLSGKNISRFIIDTILNA
ncbi:plasmid mobilization protein [Treponema pedis]|uniref:plasmid mobilization protein n=1 Tax=Treponema pedis TaxID=409322 RepID=UPI0031414F6D